MKINESDTLFKLLTLHNVKGLGDRTLFKLFEETNDLDLLLERVRSGQLGVVRQNVRLILPKERAISDMFEVVSNLNINVVPSFSKEYPPQLKHLYDPPPILYVRGEFSSSFETSLAVVGTRAYSSYGKTVLNSLLPSVVKSGVSIISGLAMGIDALAHSKALELGGFTVAVMGSGIDVIAPRQNARLYEEIVNKGCVISEFPIGTEPTRYTFPQRNRIVAALARSVLIVEAPEKSGALITAEYAADIGRDILAVPGSILSNSSRGTNKLISSGARLIMSPEDLLDAFGLVPGQLKSGDSRYRELEDIEQMIIKHIGGSTVSIDDVIQSLQEYTYDEIIGAISKLEIEGILTRASGDVLMLTR